VVAATMREYKVPGIAVAVVKDGKIVVSKGYGVRSLATKEPVDANTLFGIASNTKAFTAAALGLLVDEGKLRWDDKLTDHIPEFKLYDPYASAEFTVRDMLTHRSGLPPYAGDLMQWPDSTTFTLPEILHNLRYLKPASSFRTQFAYDNNMYLVAGELVRRLSGQSWNDFVETRLLRPLGMARSATDFKRLPDPNNAALPHAEVDGRLQPLAREDFPVMDPAGGMWSSVADLSRWTMMLLGGPGAPAPLLKPATQKELWTPQTILKPFAFHYRTHLRAYGLGWFLRDVEGNLEASHTGGLAGMVSEVKLLPEQHLGIIVLTNQEEGLAFTTVTTYLEDVFLGLPATPLFTPEQVKMMHEYYGEQNKTTAAVWKQVALAQKAAPKRPYYAPLAGRYHDAWFGDLTLTAQDSQLWLRSARSLRLVGQVLPYRGPTYVVRWRDRTLRADAFLTFAFDPQGQATGFKLKAISEKTDPSFDFEDLDVQRVAEPTAAK
jgi:CubicO group peptidase (beta-lactamase class C family)